MDNKLFKTPTAGEAEVAGVNISELVAKLRILLGVKYKKLRLPPDGDKILERSLSHRNFNIDQAADQVHSFFKLFADLSNRNDENIFLPSVLRNYFIDSFALGLMKRRNAKEQPVLFVNFDLMPAETLCVDKLFAVFTLLMIELASESIEVQNMGVAIVVDLKAFQFAHVKKFTLSRLQIVAKIIQGSLPVRFKAFHLMNAPSAFYYTYSVLSLFLRQKIKDRVHFHGSDLTEVHKVVDPDFLPTAFGGNISNEESMDTELIKKLCEKDYYYKEFFRYGYLSQEGQDS